MTDKSQPLSGAAHPAPNFSKGYTNRHGDPVSDSCGERKHGECTEDLTKCHCTVRIGHTTQHAYMNIPMPAAPVAVPAQGLEIAKEYGFDEQSAKDITAAQKKLAEKLDRPPLPPPQDVSHCANCWKLHQPAFCPDRPAALAGETRQEARKQYLNPQQRAKWERRLEAGMDKSEDFPECTPDQRAVLWTLLELKQSERLLATAESRIAQLERERDQWKRIAEDFNNCTLPAPVTMSLDPVLKLRAETAEAALTQAQQERDELKKELALNEKHADQQPRS